MSNEERVVIPLHDEGFLYVSKKEFEKRVKIEGSDIKARQYFLR